MDDAIQAGNDSTANNIVPESEATLNDGNEGNKEIVVSTTGNDPEAVHVERQKWDKPIEFLLACISMSVGLGNIWRFPLIAAQNGGGAFLIPYLTVLFVIGRPMYFLELCLGQFTSCSQIKCWKISPFFKGVGYATCFSTISVLTYYCSLMALSVFYFAVSFQKTLPWTTCDIHWGTCLNSSAVNVSRAKTIPLEYFRKSVLNVKEDSIDDGIGDPDWRLTLCLFFSWLLICLSYLKGVQSAGKFAYFTTIFPYVVLFILLIRGVSLKGAGIGILKFITPEWKALIQPTVWYNAVTQCFYSLNTGFGSIIMFSSYNDFHQNIYRDAFVISLMDTFTSLVAGMTIFSVLGHVAYKQSMTLDALLDNINGGAELAFGFYAEAIAQFDFVPQLFSVLFFLMLFTLGLGSTTSDAGAVIAVFADRFPKFPRWIITITVSVSGFLSGLMYLTPGGQWILELVDYYGGGFIITLAVFFEVTGIAWAYGVDNFILDIEFMLNIKLGWYWKICWKWLIPPALLTLLVYSIYETPVLKYNDKLSYPVAATVFGILLALTAATFLPALAVYAMWGIPGTIRERFWKSLRPATDYGPLDPKIREEWIAFRVRRYGQAITYDSNQIVPLNDVNAELTSGTSNAIDGSEQNSELVAANNTA